MAPVRGSFAPCPALLPPHRGRPTDKKKVGAGPGPTARGTSSEQLPAGSLREAGGAASPGRGEMGWASCCGAGRRQPRTARPAPRGCGLSTGRGARLLLVPATSESAPRVDDVALVRGGKSRQRERRSGTPSPAHSSRREAALTPGAPRLAPRPPHAPPGAR